MDNINDKEELLQWLSEVFDKMQLKEILVKELWLGHGFLIFPELFLMILEGTIN